MTPQTRILVVDDLPDSLSAKPQPVSPNHDPFGASKVLHNARRLDLTPHTIVPRHRNHDQLGPEIYQQAHKKGERSEKQAKNIEKERAQHEKFQLDRLLEELRGPDWLKVMGISGVTETEKKVYEPKRAYLIQEVAGMIAKFRRWKEEEKRRKLEMEQAKLEAKGELQDEDEHADADVEDLVEKEAKAPAWSSRQAQSFDGPTEYSSHEVDALAARQLHQEANFDASRPKRKADAEASMPPPPLPAPPPYKPFKSFYSKRHLRDAAVTGQRRSRTVTAFGKPVPELEEQEFELPDTILTEDTVRAQARAKRASRRKSADG